MKEKAKRMKDEVTYVVLLLLSGMLPVGSTSILVYADDGAANFNSFIQFLCQWLIRIGAVVAMVGGIQMAIGFKQDDPDAKVRGLMTLAAGFMVVGIGNAPSIFGIA